MTASDLPELATAPQTATPMTDANEPTPTHEPADTPADVETAEVSAGDKRNAVERVVAYFVALGVGGETALSLTNTLDQRIDPTESTPARRAELILEAFDRWTTG